MESGRVNSDYEKLVEKYILSKTSKKDKEKLLNQIFQLLSDEKTSEQMKIAIEAVSRREKPYENQQNARFDELMSLLKLLEEKFKATHDQMYKSAKAQLDAFNTEYAAEIKKYDKEKANFIKKYEEYNDSLVFFEEDEKNKDMLFNNPTEDSKFLEDMNDFVHADQIDKDDMVELKKSGNKLLNGKTKLIELTKQRVVVEEEIRKLMDNYPKAKTDIIPLDSIMNYRNQIIACIDYLNEKSGLGSTNTTNLDIIKKRQEPTKQERIKQNLFGDPQHIKDVAKVEKSLGKTPTKSPTTK